MGKLIAIVLLVVIGAIVFRYWGKKLRDLIADEEPAAPPPPPPAQAATDAPQAMVTCAHCSLHLPQSEALLAAPAQGGDPAGPFFCSPEHRERHAAGRPSP